MSVEIKKYRVPSTDGIHTLAGIVYLPERKAKGFYHVVHGMTEHIARYEKFMMDMAKEGWICFGYDNLGHGNTARDDSELGYIAKKDGWKLLARDVKAFSDAVRSEYSDRCTNGAPYCLMGHSMGSFIVRTAYESIVKPDKLIIMGTGGKNGAASIGLALIAVIKLFCGEKHVSGLIDNIAFGSYNERFGGGSENDPSPWLTNDEEIRKKYYADKFCTFKFTVSAMGDLIRLIKESNRNDWYKNVPRDVPVLLVSGSEDPVGNYCKGVREVYEKLKESGVSAECRIYDNARHEILNDFTYDEVKNDILHFIN